MEMYSVRYPKKSGGLLERFESFVADVRYCNRIIPLCFCVGFGWKRVAINSGPKEPKGHVNEKTREPVTYYKI
ncbi:hypothetical protein TNCV_2079311 [Trichonephila clavipes]|nr:hypothetical protein TNCV_2079311 [Trichonephila clavipes]